MKGLLYLYATLNKTAWIATAAVFACCCAIIIVTTRMFVDNPAEWVAPSGLFCALAPIIAGLVPVEMIARDFESCLKCRFTDYALAGGISKNMFVLTELVKNLLTTAATIVMGAVLFGLCYICGGEPLIGTEPILTALMIMVLCSTLNWMMMPLLVQLKDHEKAGLAIGLPTGIIGGITVLSIDEQAVAKAAEFLFSWQGQLVYYGVIAALYVLFYFIFYKRIKGGDVC